MQFHKLINRAKFQFNRGFLVFLYRQTDLLLVLHTYDLYTDFFLRCIVVMKNVEAYILILQNPEVTFPLKIY